MTLKISEMFSREKKEHIKLMCDVFEAQYILIDGERYAAPPKK
jgi:hypothetical protein